MFHLAHKRRTKFQPALFPLCPACFHPLSGIGGWRFPDLHHLGKSLHRFMTRHLIHEMMLRFMQRLAEDIDQHHQDKQGEKTNLIAFLCKITALLFLLHHRKQQAQ